MKALSDVILVVIEVKIIMLSWYMLFRRRGLTATILGYLEIFLFLFAKLWFLRRQ
jgi:hypothetical protein